MSISTLNVQAFVRRADLSLKDLQKLRKCDLTAIAQYLNVEVTQGLKKAEILDLLASHMELKRKLKLVIRLTFQTKQTLSLQNSNLKWKKRE